MQLTGQFFSGPKLGVREGYHDCPFLEVYPGGVGRCASSNRSSYRSTVSWYDGEQVGQQCGQIGKSMTYDISQWKINDIPRQAGNLVKQVEQVDSPGRDLSAPPLFPFPGHFRSPTCDCLRSRVATVHRMSSLSTWDYVKNWIWEIWSATKLASWISSRALAQSETPFSREEGSWNVLLRVNRLTKSLSLLISDPQGCRKFQTFRFRNPCH